MSRVRSKDSRAEIALRKELHALGFRYRLHNRTVIGTPDLSVQSRRIAIFMDGDLWHGNPALPAQRGRREFADLFPTRTGWWLEKINRNMERDRDVTGRLQAAGWLVVRVWESDISRDARSVAQNIIQQIECSGH
jgi:DNA mismatch endonuclease (patch repair protein)